MPITYDANTVPAISVSELSHSFKTHKALDQVSFAVMPQTLHGFVGPNGAGKTTSLKAICTLLKPDRGEVQVFGHSVRSEAVAVRERIGFMPDHFSMYRQMTVFEYLDFFAAAYGLNMVQRDQVINDVLTLTDMDGRRNDLISGLSRGMQQRVSLARVLVHDPDLLLLDEPASGLDPRARIEIRNLLKRLGELKKTVIVSSHILPELADVCTRVGMIEKGNLIVDGNVADVMKKARQCIMLNIRVKDRVEDAAKLLEQCDSVDKVNVTSSKLLEVTLKPNIEDYSDIPSNLIGNGFALTLFREEEVNLETAFMELTKGLVQ